MQPLNKSITLISFTLALILFTLPAIAAGDAERQLSELNTRVNEKLDRVEELKFKLGFATGDDVEVVEDQLLETRSQYQDNLWKLATQLGALPDENNYSPQIKTLLSNESEFLSKRVSSIRDKISLQQIELSSYIDNPPPDQLVTKVIRGYDTLIRLYAAMLDNITAKGTLNMSIQEDTKQVDQWIQDQADLLVGRIELVKGRIKIYKEQRSVYELDSENYKIAQTKIKGQQLRLEYGAKYLNKLAGLIERLGRDASIYQQTVIRATGKLSEDVLDVKVIRRLFIQWGAELKQWLLVRGPQLLSNIAAFVLIMLLASFIARIIQRFLRKALANSEIGIGTLARDFIVSISSKVVMLIGLIIALGSIGVQVGHILAGVGILGFIIGFALQDTLSNFASGIMILIYRPFDVGDYIEAAGVEGTVRKMSLVATTVYTVENHRLMLPNNKVWGNIIRNVTSQRVRRVDLMFGVAYDEDIQHVKKILHSVLDEHDKVLKSPEAVIRLHELADSSINFIVRPWVPSEDYWDVYWDLMEQIKVRFDEEGISIPFPQRDINLLKSDTLPG